MRMAWLLVHEPIPLRGSGTDSVTRQIAALKEPGGRRRADITAEDRTILRFTDLLTSRPGNIDQTDLDALGQHFVADQIVEFVIVIATANWTNRVNDGAQTSAS